MNSIIWPPRVVTAGAVVTAIGILAAGLPWAGAQNPASTAPTIGLRDNPPRTIAIRDATVIPEPGHRIEGATLLLDGPSVVAVGPDVVIPTDAEVIDGSGKIVYAGLIDAWGEAEVSRPDAELGHWNSYITPERSAAAEAVKLPATATKLRSQGITARLVAPAGGLIKGTGCLALVGGDRGLRLLRGEVATHLQLTVPRGGGPRPSYPNSPMGAVALLRQTFSDADWYRRAWQAYRADTGLPRPETDRALEALSAAMSGGIFVADAPNERMAIRADRLAREFSLGLVIRGSGREYQRLDEIRSGGRPILVPLAFPETPRVQTAQRAADTPLRDLMHWQLAPENPARLVDAGVTICLTSDGLDDPAKFLERLRQTVRRGLSPAEALAAVTVHPAELFGVADVAGRVRPGSLANLVVTDGDLFDAKTKVVETWIAGQRYPIRPEPIEAADQIVGDWRLTFDPEADAAPDDSVELRLRLRRKGNGWEGTLSSTGDDAADRQTKLKDIVRHRDRLSANVELKPLHDRFMPGLWRMTWVTLSPAAGPADARREDAGPLAEGEPDRSPQIFASLLAPDGRPVPVAVRPEGSPADRESATDESATDESATDEAATDEATADESATDESATDEATAEQEPSAEEPAETPETETPSPSPGDASTDDAPGGAPGEPESRWRIEPNYPLGAYGLAGLPDRPDAVVFRNATVWTCGDAGIVEGGDLLVIRGRIAEVGVDLKAPDGCLEIDATGKHLSPGLIDCHSHMATDGGINESGQAVTAEVRIGDFIDNTDIHIYRQLAGGLTIANILHGSANPIGGQNQVIKLRWGGSMDELRMTEAPPGIKFALGENVKRNTSRYPNTRMGVEQLLRDRFLAAREYAVRHRDWSRGQGHGLPPRRDLELEALAEIQRGERWIHCHSYRQDEIVATLDVLEEFGIRIGTLQHILEGYKVADRIARHGAMASSFSDWWAYKFEVYDAIPYNGVLMHEAGVVVSYNSDDRELARRLNTEAAKAVKYGGVPPEEALKFVTTNPAKQLRIDPWVGTLDPGKHADLVVWSGPPLSTTSRCEQTWIDGRRYFDLESDRELRERDAALHARLVQRALGVDVPTPADDRPGDRPTDPPGGGWRIAEEDRWLRYDEFCNASASAARPATDVGARADVGASDRVAGDLEGQP